jgi:hypothetical protein
VSLDGYVIDYGTAEHFDVLHPIVWVTTDQNVIGGTSGTYDTEAIAIVSVLCDSGTEAIGPQPLLSRCLSRHFFDQIDRSKTKHRE